MMRPVYPLVLLSLLLSLILTTPAQAKTNHQSDALATSSEQSFAPWLALFERRFSQRAKQLCPAGPAFWLRARQTDFAKSLHHKHSYLRTATYFAQPSWTASLRPLQRYLSRRAGRDYSLSETTFCVAVANQEKPWALLDSALFLDGHIYEALERGRDPLQVMQPAALELRQELFNLAMARALSEFLRRHGVLPAKKIRKEQGQVLAARALGQSSYFAHRLLLSLEALPFGFTQLDATTQGAEILQPRLADQPLFAAFVIDAASQKKLDAAQRIFCTLDARHCQDLAPQHRPKIKTLTTALRNADNLVTVLAQTDLAPEDALYVLGGVAANRFHGLYDLAPHLIRQDNFSTLGPLLFFGAAVHFQMQQADAQQIAKHDHYLTLAPEIAPPTQPPLLKTYHFWTEALLACVLAKRGLGAVEIQRGGAIIGRHYRGLMSPAYFAYRFYLGEDPWRVVASNRQAIALHVHGSQLGYKICLSDSWDVVKPQ